MSIARSIGDSVEAELNWLLRLELEELSGLAQRDAPIDEGTLRGSDEIEIRETPTGAEGTVSFNTPYAAKQHEETGYEHPKGGKAKYLEDHVKGMVPLHRKAMAEGLRRGLG